MAKVGIVRPVKTSQINDGFAAHLARGSFTPGVDFNCAVGETLHAAETGIVLIASTNANCGAGMNITIRHRDGSRTIYFHLSQVAVKPLQRVKQGQVIGKTGNTGTQTTGPHLHFAVQQKGKFVDPEKVFAQTKQDAIADRKAGMLPTHGIIPG